MCNNDKVKPIHSFTGGGGKVGGSMGSVFVIGFDRSSRGRATAGTIKSKISLLSRVFGPYKLLLLYITFFSRTQFKLPCAFPAIFVSNFFFFFFFSFLTPYRTYVTVLNKIQTRSVNISRPENTASEWFDEMPARQPLITIIDRCTDRKNLHPVVKAKT